MNLTIDKEKHLIILEDKEFDLSKKEFEMLSFLALSPQKMFTRNSIFSNVWGNSSLVDENSVDVHISRIRKKLGSKLIRSKRGIGYSLNITNVTIISDSDL